MFFGVAAQSTFLHAQDFRVSIWFHSSLRRLTRGVSFYERIFPSTISLAEQSTQSRSAGDCGSLRFRGLAPFRCGNPGTRVSEAKEIVKTMFAKITRITMRVTFPEAILARISVLHWPDSSDRGYSGGFGNRFNRRHCEFIWIFNLIRNSFATISQAPIRPQRLHGRRRHRRRLPRGRFASRAFSTPSRVSPLSLMALVSLLPLYFLHGASLSLTSSLRPLFSTPLPLRPASPSPSSYPVSSQISCIFYTTYLPPSTTVTPSPT